MNNDEYNRIKQEIVNECERKLAALDVVMGISRGITGTRKKRKPHSESFRAKIRAAIKGDEEFTAKQISLRMGFDGCFNMVANTLSNMRHDGELVVARREESSGPMPLNVYRLPSSSNGHPVEEVKP